MRPVSLKKRILLPLVVAGLVILVIGSYFLNNIQTQQMRDVIEQEAKSLHSHLQSVMNTKAEVMAASLSFIIQNRQLMTALQVSDRQRLLELSAPIYERLNKLHNITHFYFHDARRVNLLRVHKPEKYGDNINRFTALGAEKSAAIFSGIELGPLGTFTLRTVFPVFDDNRQLLGYMELGQEIDIIIKETHTMFDVELFMFIDKKFLVQAEWEKGMRMLAHSSNWNMHSDVVLVSQSLQDMPGRLLNQINSSDAKADISIHSGIKVNEHNFGSAIIPIQDAGERRVGSLAMLHDMTALLEHSKTEKLWFALLFALISVSIFILFYLILGKAERDLSSARQKLLTESEARTRQVEQALNIQRVLDAMLNLSLPPLTMKEVLLKSLDEVLSIPAFALLKKGSIFLVSEENDVLEMVSQRNLPDALLQSCARLAFGQCLCGRAAATREVVFVNHLSEQHEITYNGIEPHGHYCIPIMLEGRLLGVLNAYVEAGHVKDETEEGFLINVANTLAGVIERKQLEQQLKKLAHNDSLTGLPNRTLFYDRLNQNFSLAQRHKKQFAIFFLDLDHFKDINDTLGHDMGDVLLQQTANRLLSCVRKSDTVARMGGDEFIVVLTETKTLESVELVAKNILKSLLEPFNLNGKSCSVGCSIGIALYPKHGRDSETLLKNADSAMYYAKRERNSYCLFKESLT